MMNDLISDALTRIRNAQRAAHSNAQICDSSAVRAVLEVLKKEGFIQGYVEKTDEESGFKVLDVSLKYYSNGQPLITQALRLSKSGRRVYAGTKDIPHISSGLGVVIVSTSKGVISDREARSQGIGGELIASIY